MTLTPRTDTMPWRCFRYIYCFFAEKPRALKKQNGFEVNDLFPEIIFRIR